MYVGDFNLAKINWSVNSSLSDIESLSLDFMSHNGFKQINNIYNDNSHILELAFVAHDLDTDLFLPISPLFEKPFTTLLLRLSFLF